MIRGAVYTAKHFGIVSFIIGMTTIAFETSGPELVFVLNAISQGSEVIVLGILVGSNISNILLILGATLLIVKHLPSLDIEKANIIFLQAEQLFSYF